MDLVDVGRAAADFLATVHPLMVHGKVSSFASASTWPWILPRRCYEEGTGSLGTTGATQAQQSVMPLPPPRLPLTQPAVIQPVAAQPATTSFWEQLEEFTQGLDTGGGSSALSELTPNRSHWSPRAPSPPARLPSPGATEIIHIGDRAAAGISSAPGPTHGPQHCTRLWWRNRHTRHRCTCSAHQRASSCRPQCSDHQ